MVTNSTFCFDDLLSALSPYTAGGQQKQLEFKKRLKSCFFYICHQEFTFMSMDLYMTVSEMSEMNNEANQINA